MRSIALSGKRSDRLPCRSIELRNMHEVALLIARCALWREESRGAHYRTDFPEKRVEFQRPSAINREGKFG